MVAKETKDFLNFPGAGEGGNLTGQHLNLQLGWPMRYSLPLASCSFYSWSLLFQLVCSVFGLLPFCSLFDIGYSGPGCSHFQDCLFGAIMFECEQLSESLLFWDWLYGTGVCQQLPCASLFIYIVIIRFSVVVFFVAVFCFLCLMKLFLSQPPSLSVFNCFPIPLVEGEKHLSGACLPAGVKSQYM